MQGPRVQVQQDKSLETSAERHCRVLNSDLVREMGGVLNDLPELDRSKLMEASKALNV
jgi:hypothetical protein